MASQTAFTDKQFEFAAHIRNPGTNPKPGDVEARRMKIYNDLFYNNVEGFMANSYPVLREIYDDQAWHKLIRDYFEQHRASTPLFPEMPGEFLKYLEHERHALETDYPFLLELAHYEWAELALSLSNQEPDWRKIDKTVDLLDGEPVISPLAWILSYQWPVQNIGPNYLPEEAPETETYLLLYRDSEDEVHFMELNPVTARLLQLIQDKKLNSSRQMLIQIAEELSHPEPQTVIQGGLNILQDLYQRQVILGCYK